MKRFTEDQKRLFDQTMINSYPWSDPARIIEAGENPEFITELYEQNLEHARHVENERLTYCAGTSALVIGGLAAIGAIQNNYINLFISIILLLISILSYKLNERWSNAFDRHTLYAKGCYYILQCNTALKHIVNQKRKQLLTEAGNDAEIAAIHPTTEMLQEWQKERYQLYLNRIPNDKIAKDCKDDIKTIGFFTKMIKKEFFKVKGRSPYVQGDPVTPEDQDNLYLSTLPLYCFDISNPISKRGKVDHRKTKSYFRLYYALVILMMAIITVGLIIKILPW